MTETPAVTQSSGSRAGRIIAGLLLALPAVFACGITFVIPSLALVQMSFQKVAVLQSGASQQVGMANYATIGKLLSSGGAVGMTLLVTGVRLAAVLIVPPLLALGVSRSLPALKTGSRLLLTIPAALFAPFLALTAWILGSHPQPSPEGYRVALLLAEGFITLALGCAVITPLYLAALNQPGGKIAWRPLIIIWVVSLLAVIALTPQGLATSFVTQGGPARSTETLMLLIYRQAFVNFQLGPAAALSVLMLVGVMLIGLMAGAAVVWSGLGLQTAPPDGAGQAASGRAGPILVGVGMLALALGCAALAALPYLVQSTPNLPARPDVTQRILSQIDLGSALALTILPQAFGVFLIQLPLAYLAALGIGAARPLGKTSELLLLLFSPWLFVTEGPLLIPFFMAARQTETLNTIAALLPRFAISVPILFILTLFFKGQEARRQAAGAEGGSSAGSIFRFLILPSLPLAVLLGFAAVLVGMQSIAWPLIAINTPDKLTIPLVIARVGLQYATDRQALIGLIIAAEGPIFIAWLVIFAVFQVFYLPRLAVTRPGSLPATVEPPASPVEESTPPAEPQDAKPAGDAT